MDFQPLHEDTLIEVKKTIFGILKYAPKDGETEALERILSRAGLKPEKGGIFATEVLIEINQKRGNTPVDEYLLLHESIYTDIEQYLPESFRVGDSITDIV